MSGILPASTKRFAHAPRGNRQHFLAMMANAAYREALVHRYDGLERTILMQMQG